MDNWGEITLLVVTGRGPHLVVDIRLPKMEVNSYLGDSPSQGLGIYIYIHNGLETDNG